MKQNKGFTLIELLAVLVILAIIALITTPIVLSAISTAQTRANKESARGYISAMEFYCATTLLNSGSAPTWATAKANVSTVSKGTTVTVVDGTSAFDSGCRVTGTGTFNGWDLTGLNS